MCPLVCGPPAQRRTSLANVSLPIQPIAWHHSERGQVSAPVIGPSVWRVLNLLLQPKSGAVSSSGASSSCSSSSNNSRQTGAFNSFTKGEILSFIHTVRHNTYFSPPASVGRGRRRRGGETSRAEPSRVECRRPDP